MKDVARKLGKATARGAALFGMRAEDVIVVANAVEGGGPIGAPSATFEVFGIAGDAAMKESRVRVRAALACAGIDMGAVHVCVRVGMASGADACGGAALDLPIAAAVLGALGEVPVSALDGTLFAGELTLHGSVRGVRGVLPMIAEGGHFARFVMPSDNEGEAAFGAALRAQREGSRGERDVRVVTTLAELAAALRGEVELSRAEARAARAATGDDGLDVADVVDPVARRALEIAAAGGHGMLLVGPPGAGKTMIARRLPSLLPALGAEEAFEVNAIHSAAGMLGGGKSVVRDRPFRAPHHTVSEAGLTGGGGGASGPRPDEASLAHGGMLFLDELPEFRCSALGALARVVRDGKVRFLRTSRDSSRRDASFPAAPIVVGATNACPCGYRGMPGDRCTCAEARVEAYGKRVDGVRGFFDMEIRVRPVSVSELREPSGREPGEAVRGRVALARKRQAERQVRLGFSSPLNGLLSAAEAERAVGGAASLARFPSRGSAKVWRVARTIADLAASDEVTAAHLAEAAEFVGVNGAEPIGVDAGSRDAAGTK